MIDWRPTTRIHNLSSSVTRNPKHLFHLNFPLEDPEVPQTSRVYFSETKETASRTWVAKIRMPTSQLSQWEPNYKVIIYDKHNHFFCESNIIETHFDQLGRFSDSGNKGEQNLHGTCNRFFLKIVDKIQKRRSKCWPSVLLKAQEPKSFSSLYRLQFFPRHGSNVAFSRGNTSASRINIQVIPWKGVKVVTLKILPPSPNLHTIRLLGPKVNIRKHSFLVKHIISIL